MAEKRMISKKIIDCDSFLEMSAATQALYFHLNMGADDDGFNNQLQMAMYKAHASVDDLKILVLKNFVIKFENGAYVIKHWRVHNTLRKDRYVPTSFQNELHLLNLEKDKSYAFSNQMSFDLDSQIDCVEYGITELKNLKKESWQPNGNQMATSGCRRLDKNRLDKNRLDNSYINYIYSPNEQENSATNDIEISKKTDLSLDLQMEIIFKTWNEMEKTIHHNELSEIRKTAIKKALSKFDGPQITQAIKNYDLVLKSNWYFKYRWSLEDFLNRKNGLPTFTEEGSNWNSFQDEVKKNPLLLPREYLSKNFAEENLEAPQSFMDFLKRL